MYLLSHFMTNIVHKTQFIVQHEKDSSKLLHVHIMYTIHTYLHKKNMKKYTLNYLICDIAPHVFGDKYSFIL